ncbi:DUF6875 domain-containing protein [Streptomyces sp. NPDC090231]|uniref:DUF6875 domain-containing protein n=1 Tax=unclassified Streptomyces TaxID=2593676 RepID=UPI0038122E9B
MQLLCLVGAAVMGGTCFERAMAKDAAGEADRWFKSYLCRPHEGVGRPGAVCPFMAPALRARGVQTQAFNGSVDREGLLAVVDTMVNTLRSGHWPSSNRSLHAVVALLPDLPQAAGGLLDRVHAEVKPSLAEHGMMLGQFHPRCNESAARNPGFPVSRSPVPMLALRWMALHDVLFLHDDPLRFAAYDRRFGSVYRSGRTVDPLFAELYRRARS